ncbi:13382_t:CDS:1, partial [Acaulospora colombiana]
GVSLPYVDMLNISQVMGLVSVTQLLVKGEKNLHALRSVLDPS